MVEEEKQPDAPEPLHASIRMDEVEPIIGKRGKWFYVGWVAFWVVLLTVVLVFYVMANRLT